MKHLILAAAGAALLVASPAAAEEFYEGKTINCIVPYAPGGGTDSFFRVVVPHLARVTPGQPEIVITNMDGAGGMKANNYVSQDAPNDGSEMLCAPWLSIAQLTKRAGVRFDYSAMELIGGESAIDTAIISTEVLPDGEVKNIADASRIVIAGLSPSSTLDLRQRLALDLLGVEYLYVPGYRGQAKQLPAFLSGEVSLVGSNYGTYAATAKEAFIDNGPGTLFVHYPSFDADGNPVPSPEMEALGVMRLDELYEHVHGSAPGGELWKAFKTIQTLSNMGLSAWLPEGSPQEAIDALRAGWQALPNDPEFQEAHRKAFGKEVNFLSTDDALLAQASVGDASAEMAAFFQDYIAKGEQ